MDILDVVVKVKGCLTISGSMALCENIEKIDDAFLAYLNSTFSADTMIERQDVELALAHQEELRKPVSR